MWRNYIIHTSGGMQNVTATLRNTLDNSLKTKHTTIIAPSNCTLGHLSREIKTYVHAKTCTQKFIHFICYNCELETTQMSPNR